MKKIIKAMPPRASVMELVDAAQTIVLILFLD